jgi:hypothetical protein
MSSGKLRSSCSTCDTRRVNLVKNRWQVMKEEMRMGLWLPQIELVHGNLWHRYFITVNQVMMTIQISVRHLNFVNNITILGVLIWLLLFYKLEFKWSWMVKKRTRVQHKDSYTCNLNLCCNEQDSPNLSADQQCFCYVCQSLYMTVSLTSCP